jgi:hypothetical protein
MMKARDFDTLMSILGAATAIALVVLKGLGLLALETNDCILCGALVASATKFIAIARVAEVIKGKVEPNTTEGA